MSNPFAPDMVRQLKSVADPALAPDGSRVVFTYGWVEEETLESINDIDVYQRLSELLVALGSFCRFLCRICIVV